MNYLSAKIIKYNSSATSSKLKEELISFVTNWEKLKLTLENTYEINYNPDLNDTDNIDNSDYVEVHDAEICSMEKGKNTCKSCKNCARCRYAIILKYNMFQGAYSALVTAYQYFLTLPISQVECERSFSILKYIKNILKSQLTDNRMESFMIMNIEKSILNEIDNHEVINSLAVQSTLLKKALIY
ncbi:hypothetical protein ALC57_14192 [Trachymyrmex cornetzi]|uniref:HAT C-terminal dimerisation domain-containing protein n=1 Tax=Trachymyrmex cornetzi TaxID=471704 RepID=A0A151IYL6_9HYME|nr:hypothetical protein ALC57_14192 [Trachymyrmex cornetzi]